MGDGLQPDDAQPDGARQDERRGLEGASSASASAGLDRRFRMALVLYAVLGLLVWFTMGEGRVFIHGRPVELRLVPLIVIGGLALRTLVAHQAEKIRRQDGKASGSSGL